MASSNDNAMSRFLFAILQQKNLKDIDWNQVAHNPILTQGITNGHAARMRYSRFKQSILGHDPKPRNRNANKAKVSKSKKEPKAKKEIDEQIKPDSSSALEAQQEDPKTESHQIKSETLVKIESQPLQTDARLTPGDLPSASIADTHMHFQNRLLTPCSDTDFLVHTHQGFSNSPVSDLHHNQPFSYTGVSAQYAGGDQNTWQPSPSPYSPFSASYDVEGYSASPFIGQHHAPHPDNFGIAPSAMMAPDPSHTPVKHEEWDTRFHP